MNSYEDTFDLFLSLPSYYREENSLLQDFQCDVKHYDQYFRHFFVFFCIKNGTF